MQTLSCLGSGFAHAVALAGLFIGQLWLQLQAAPEAPERKSPIVLEGGFLPWRPTDERAAPIVVERPASELPSVASAAMLAGQVNDAIAQAQGATVEEQLEQLKRRSAELSGVSSAESIDQMARQLNALLGAKPRAERPSAEPVEGPFDFDSAQLHDVEREPLESGGYHYRTVLVDAKGRRFETEVDAATGEQLYKVFEIIRGNPLLEKVYRQVVMGLLDKLAQPKPAP